MPANRSNLRRLAAVTAAAAMAVAGLAVTASPADALAAPGKLKVTVRNASTAILTWGTVNGATSYEVQVDSTSSFSSPDFSLKTTNTKAVPTKSLMPGKNFWRVRAYVGTNASDWVSGGFEMAPVTTPIPLAPADGAVLQQPQSPPLLQWSSSQGAVSYTVTVDADSDMLGAKSYSTKTTSLVVPDPLTVGDWYWQVTAVKGAGLVSLPSAVTRFDISPLAQPKLTYPANDVSQTIQDVALDWEPVPGAKTYDVQVAIDEDFNSLVMDVKNVFGTRYSPPITLRNGAFWWRVRAVDLGGQQTPWSKSQFTFTRDWLDVTTAVFPAGDPATPPVVTDSRQYFQWTPVKHASYYELIVGNDISGWDSCTTAGTTYVPRNATDCAFKPSPQPTYWQVRPMDKPYPDIGVPGILSPLQGFSWNPPAAPGGAFVKGTVPANLRVAVAGNALDDPAKACFDELCDAVPATPVFAWDPVPGATSYHVYVSPDKNFTFKALGRDDYLDTKNTAVALTYKMFDDIYTLPESDVGNSFFWYVVACGPTGCGTSPVSQNPPLPGWRSFRKVSPAVTGLSASNVNGSDITFDWQDYIVANSNPSLWRGQMGTQAAQSYRIQVDDDPSFASPVDTATVDQTTYTAPGELYPEGTYFWRVQARDMGNNYETWSQVQTFTKATPAVSLSSPVGGAVVSGTTPFRWVAQPFASGYTIEVYKNNDLTFSQANRIVAATVKTAAYAPSSPIPASTAPYVWRVRKIDTSNNPSAWSATGTFFSTGVAPNLLSPKAGVWMPNAGSLFEWTEVPGAASYSLNIAGKASAKVATVATAFAPGAFASGSYTWNVTAYDGAGAPLATSATRQYQVDATAPFVKSISPQKLKATSVVKVKFSEKVKGISSKSIKLYFLKGEKQKKVLVKAKVKQLKKGKGASVDPKGRLKSGDYLIVFFLDKIRDVHGNSLVASSATPLVRQVAHRGQAEALVVR